MQITTQNKGLYERHLQKGFWKWEEKWEELQIITVVATIENKVILKYEDESAEKIR